MARYQMAKDGPLHSPDLTLQEPIMERAMDDLNSKATAVQAGSIDFAALGHPDLAAQYSTPEMQQKVDCLQLQARVSEVGGGWGGGRIQFTARNRFLKIYQFTARNTFLKICQFTAWNRFLKIYISLQPGMGS